MIHPNGFSQCSACPQSKGQWKNPHGTYHVDAGSRDAAVRHGVQIPCHDPTVLIPALAREVPHLGFASTYSTSYLPPHHPGAAHRLGAGEERRAG